MNAPRYPIGESITTEEQAVAVLKELITKLESGEITVVRMESNVPRRDEYADDGLIPKELSEPPSGEVALAWRRAVKSHKANV